MIKRDQKDSFNHGSTQGAWNAAKAEARRAMIIAAARRDLIYYSVLVNEINTCRLIPNGLQLAQMLSEISTEEHQAGHGMLSVVVVRKKDNMPGTGFFNLARSLSQHVDDVKTFWDQELEKVYATWSSVAKT